ncbi:MAG: GIY-YIG nuclease family protein [Xanthomonadales bacterium]|nr:GIY-YIG nuclease family protein [Xanthomonadales bacterium]
MPRILQPAVYILASGERKTLYTGVTSDLVQRVWQHRQDLVEGFTRRYHVHTLVWYELHDTMNSAITREKAIKSWKRVWKLELVESTNPEWRDLYPDIV